MISLNYLGSVILGLSVRASFNRTNYYGRWVSVDKHVHAWHDFEAERLIYLRMEKHSTPGTTPYKRTE